MMRNLLKGDGTRARSLRSSALVVIGFGGANVLRLTSNLILTRLLFPEAFGLMALVNIFLIGLQMFSDVGLNVSIIQNKRGDDPAFLNTAWTLQIIRGFILWICSCALAYPVAAIYNEPMLIQLLPVAGLAAIIAGFTTTKVALANRHLQIGVQTFSELGSQFIGLIITIILAITFKSIWALVIGTLCATFLKVAIQHIFLKGHSDRLQFDKSACSDLLSFGKFIFLSSIAGFVVNQSDRAILGAYVPLVELGIFSVGYLMASTPWLLSAAASSKVVLPLYRKFPVHESLENRKKVAKARHFILIGAVSISGILSLSSIPLINILYDERYATAGPMLALMGFAVATNLVITSYQGAYLSRGDSKWQFYLIGSAAIIKTCLALLLIPKFGTVGAIAAFGLTPALMYPFHAYIARKYQSWAPHTDALVIVIGFTSAALATWVWWQDITLLLSQF